MPCLSCDLRRNAAQEFYESRAAWDKSQDKNLHLQSTMEGHLEDSVCNHIFLSDTFYYAQKLYVHHVAVNPMYFISAFNR